MKVGTMKPKIPIISKVSASMGILKSGKVTFNSWRKSWSNRIE